MIDQVDEWELSCFVDEIDVHSFDANKLAPTPVERPIRKFFFKSGQSTECKCLSCNDQSTKMVIFLPFLLSLGANPNFHVRFIGINILWFVLLLKPAFFSWKSDKLYSSLGAIVLKLQLIDFLISLQPFIDNKSF